MSSDIKPAQPLPEFAPLPATVEAKPEPKREEPALTDEIARPRYVGQVIIIALLILASTLFWRYGLKPELDRMAVDCTAGEVK